MTMTMTRTKKRTNMNNGEEEEEKSGDEDDDCGSRLICISSPSFFYLLFYVYTNYYLDAYGHHGHHPA
jgi:hypothetical protein